MKFGGLETSDLAPLKQLEDEFEDQLFLTTVTIGEIEKGLILAESRMMNMDKLRSFLSNQLIARFGSRILSYDVKAAVRWGVLMGSLTNDKHAER